MGATARRCLAVALVVLVLDAVLFGALIWDAAGSRSRLSVTKTEAEELIRDSLPLSETPAAACMRERLSIRALSVTSGRERDAVVRVAYETPDAWGLYAERKDELFASAWRRYEDRTAKGRKVSATDISNALGGTVADLLAERPLLGGEIDVRLYDTGKGRPVMRLSDEAVDALLGGYVAVRRDIAATETIVVDGETVSIASKNNLRTGIKDCFGLDHYGTEKPETSSGLRRAWRGFADEFRRNFIEKQRWTYLVSGLGNTLAITALSLLLGLALGFLTALARTVRERTGRLRLADAIGRAYVSVIRGTPVMIQLLIIYFVLLLPIGVEKFPAAVLCFGLNSGAYVSEIIRGGILSVEAGQAEAGRSLGFGFGQTMGYIVLPQALKASLPALCNEFISLLKETSVAFYIGVSDLTQGGLRIRSVTYSNFMPLVAVALIYLAVVLILTRLVRILERRLRRSECS